MAKVIDVASYHYRMAFSAILIWNDICGLVAASTDVVEEIAHDRIEEDYHDDGLDCVDGLSANVIDVAGVISLYHLFSESTVLVIGLDRRGLGRVRAEEVSVIDLEEWLPEEVNDCLVELLRSWEECMNRFLLFERHGEALSSHEIL